VIGRLDEAARLPRPDRDRPLGEVFKDFGGCLRPSGPYGEIDEWSVYDENFRRLVRWAKEGGCHFEGLQPLKEGGREHDLTYDPATGTWLKFTKPCLAGYMVSFDSGVPAMEPALPMEYFERLLLHNEVFADTVAFVGIGGELHRPRIITRQADIAGDGASVGEIVDLMTGALGFTALPPSLSLGYADSLAFAREDVAVFDLRPANVVRTAGGLIVPIDTIPVRLDPERRSMLGM
jgi:hypothetical protein